MDPVVHFEFPTADRERAKKFYSAVFGWQMQETGPEMGNYIVVSTVEADSNDPMKRPKKPGAINGGFYGRSDEDPWRQHPSVVIAVRDLEESMKKIVAAGGKLHGEAMDIPGIGRYASFMDTEGNMVSVLQPKM
ncbi:MAG: VOC family protein [Patescibacteria group bacterium]|nr:VOC family protein [Patescibacteria group bacterium]